MTLEEFYRKNGGDAVATVSRLGSAAMTARFLRMFREDDSFRLLKAAMQRGSGEEAFRAAHTLKGLAANLGLESLREATSALVEALRGGDAAKGKGLVPAVERAYGQAMSGIERLDMETNAY